MPLKISYGGTVFVELVGQSPEVGAWLTANCNGILVKSKGPTTVYTLPFNMKVDVQVSYVDAEGNPATVDGDVTWETSDKDIANVFRIAPNDSTRVSVRPGGKLGQAQVTATADADLGEGVRELICTMDVSVVSGEAVAGTITPVGDPEPI